MHPQSRMPPILSCAACGTARCTITDDRSPARLLAPLALVAVRRGRSSRSCSARASSATTSDGDSAATGRPPAATERTTTSEQPTAAPPATYTVKTGDTLGGIAEKTGVSVERLQELNPELDPQALVAGQKIKLRE